jgi:hypothetical protein
MSSHLKVSQLVKAGEGFEINQSGSRGCAWNCSALLTLNYLKRIYWIIYLDCPGLSPVSGIAGFRAQWI